MRSFYLSASSFRAGCLLLFIAVFCSACVNDQELEFNPQLDITPTCSDGFKNQDETAVDCGGICSDICGPAFVAPCVDELKLDVVVSPTDDLYLEIIRVTHEINIYSNNIIISGYVGSNSYDDKVMVTLPIKDFPAGNREFEVVENFDSEKPYARVEIDPEYGQPRISITGKVFLRVVDEEIIHVDFCDILFETNDYHNAGFHKFQGNFSFGLNDNNQ